MDDVFSMKKKSEIVQKKIDWGCKTEGENPVNVGSRN